MSIDSEIRADVQESPAQWAADKSYDAVPYSVCSFPQTRPDRLAATATLLGMNPPSPDRCRVLELGCASGGNLIPLALAHPNSEFVGIDLSPRQIKQGQDVARELGLSNLKLQAMSILDWGADSEQFDYILTHGVYSWVPPQVQERILQISARQLSPQGVAYVSYNTYPGWHARAAIREMMWFHTRHLEDAVERIGAARQLMAFLAAATGSPGGKSNGQAPARSDGGYGALLQQELKLLQRVPDTYLLHEHLEEFNEPLYFHQFVQRVADHGLQYLAEAQINSMMVGRYGPEIEKTLRGFSGGLLDIEQYMDFLRNRMFRQTLLCHAEVRLAERLQPAAMESLYIASVAEPSSKQVCFEPEQVEEFRAPGNICLQSRDPLMKAAMWCLHENDSVPVSFAELIGCAHRMLNDAGVSDGASGEAFAGRLLNAFAAGVIELSASAPCYTAKISQKPAASPYARLRAREGGNIVNYRLEPVALGEPSRLVLSHLDGQHDTDALVRVVVEWTRSAGRDQGATAPTAAPIEERAVEYIQRFLRAAGRHALLHG